LNPLLLGLEAELENEKKKLDKWKARRLSSPLTN
jgi:hypothetical protein